VFIRWVSPKIFQHHFLTFAFTHVIALRVCLHISNMIFGWFVSYYGSLCLNSSYLHALKWIENIGLYMFSMRFNRKTYHSFICFICSGFIHIHALPYKCVISSEITLIKVKMRCLIRLSIDGHFFATRRNAKPTREGKNLTCLLKKLKSQPIVDKNFWNFVSILLSLISKYYYTICTLLLNDAQSQHGCFSTSPNQILNNCHIDRKRWLLSSV